MAQSRYGAEEAMAVLHHVAFHQKDPKSMLYGGSDVCFSLEPSPMGV